MPTSHVLDSPTPTLGGGRQPRVRVTTTLAGAGRRHGQEPPAARTPAGPAAARCEPATSAPVEA